MLEVRIIWRTGTQNRKWHRKNKMMVQKNGWRVEKVHLGWNSETIFKVLFNNHDKKKSDSEIPTVGTTIFGSKYCTVKYRLLRQKTRYFKYHEISFANMGPYWTEITPLTTTRKTYFSKISHPLNDLACFQAYHRLKYTEIR